MSYLLVALNGAIFKVLREANDDGDWKFAKSKTSKTKQSKSKQSPGGGGSDFLKNIPKTDEFNVEIVSKIRSLVEDKSKVLIIMRGLPGAGKSTLASQIVFNGTILSADSYFINLNGVYVFDSFKLSDAHHNCKVRALDAIKKGISPVIIDNTNLKVFEFQPYVSMGVKHNYHIELVEPNTPWKLKPNILTEKNQHGVNLSKIKKALIDFDSNIDLEKLIADCKTDSGVCLNSATASPQVSKPRPKPGSFISNFDEYINKVEWAIPESDTQIDSPSTSSASKSEDKISLVSYSASNDEPPSPPHKNELLDLYDSEKSLTEIDSSVEILQQMFPDIKEEIIIDFLLKYDNDVSIVTEILLDSFSFTEVASEVVVKKNETETRQDKVCLVNSLQSLCIKAMEKLEARLEEFYDMTDSDAVVEKSVRFEVGDLDETKSKTTLEDNLTPKTSFETELSEEPLFNLSLNREFLTTLIRIFGNEEEEKYLDDENRVGIGINIGQQLYLNWKNTEIVKKTKVQSKDEQLENDKKLGIELFEEINFRDPIDKTPVYFSDKGLNSAEISLRQIMAEEELMQKNQTTKKLNGIPSNHFYSSPNLLSHTNQIPREKHYANLVKLDILFRKYENIVDKKAIEQVFKNKEFDIVKTMDHINEFYDITSIKDPVNKFNFTKKEEKSKGSAPNLKFNPSNIPSDPGLIPDYEPNRQETRRYLKIRQEFFEKANEAHARGWGSVAQYYAEMGHLFSKQVKESNEAASAKIFTANNHDLKSNNTLDLHGLHVDEAISALKNVLNSKRNELSTPNGKKRKTYIFVITGYGHHSQNGPRLRPNIINFLNQKEIKYSEPHIGLLKVELLN